MAVVAKSINRGGIGGRGVSIQWKPELGVFAEAIRDLRDPCYDIIYDDLAPFVTLLRTQAQSKVHANEPWTDRTGVATRGLMAFRRRGASFMTLALQHGPRTVSSHGWNGGAFYYGIALETFVWSGSKSVKEMKAAGFSKEQISNSAFGVQHAVDPSGHGTYAVIMPTMEANYAAVMAAFRGLLARAIARQGVVR